MLNREALSTIRLNLSMAAVCLTNTQDIEELERIADDIDDELVTLREVIEQATPVTTEPLVESTGLSDDIEEEEEDLDDEDFGDEDLDDDDDDTDDEGDIEAPQRSPKDAPADHYQPA